MPQFVRSGGIISLMILMAMASCGRKRTPYRIADPQQDSRLRGEDVLGLIIEEKQDSATLVEWALDEWNKKFPPGHRTGIYTRYTVYFSVSSLAPDGPDSFCKWACVTIQPLGEMEPIIGLQYYGMAKDEKAELPLDSVIPGGQGEVVGLWHHDQPGNDYTMGVYRSAADGSYILAQRWNHHPVLKRIEKCRVQREDKQNGDWYQPDTSCRMLPTCILRPDGKLEVFTGAGGKTTVLEPVR